MSSTPNIIRTDPLSKDICFDARSETTNKSFVSTRVANSMYNTYSGTTSDLRITGMVSTSSQYDGRLDNKTDPSTLGEGFDLNTLTVPNMYNRVAFGSFAITGDQGIKKDIILKATKEMCYSKNNLPVVYDVWGSTQSARNVGIDKPKEVTMPRDFSEEKVNGLLGGLERLKSRSKERGVGDMRLTMTVGGWQFSNPFHQMVRDEKTRCDFTDGILDVLKRFPMFDELIVDWEYPGSCDPQQGNQFSEDDTKFYSFLLKETREKMDKCDLGRIELNITLPGTVDQLKRIDVRKITESGVRNIYLLTNNYFGDWKERELDHISSINHIKPAVEHLLSLGVNSKCIHIEYSTHSRNVTNAKIESPCPLKGTFEKTDKMIVGTFESGVSSFNDILVNYLDITSGKGKNGFQLYTDTRCDADFLYNHQSKVFISLDTPRTVRAKGDYVREKKLGGLFNLSISYDASGLLLNAACEGLGLKVEKQTIDMSKLYYKGLTQSITTPQQ
ncbi:hypothetical protein DICPUDRAFT_88230 [Dictyostelium purpureum]|uniref:GH18 domain-containing protein n=1 Tax=Dictyostelium purpureum TaxID=5786 RepID=F0ZN61_DICPU|nr:uncharacterized protein DICPUDRAFT_88230 [Dictyostelium purpureum]EGC34625.1 hypothetical protein DICPUDRAFT_88230 [Dictyostelium purpureum]|eukprot:XP_003288850.1 hypothetical protein DICPUDRAFT_88230 [Dictyostelium purpureum]